MRPSWLLVRTENAANGGRSGVERGGGGKVKNAPLATSYLHKLSHCGARHGNNLVCKCVGGSLLTRRDFLSFLKSEWGLQKHDRLFSE